MTELGFTCRCKGPSTEQVQSGHFKKPWSLILAQIGSSISMFSKPAPTPILGWFSGMFLVMVWGVLQRVGFQQGPRFEAHSWRVLAPGGKVRFKVSPVYHLLQVLRPPPHLHLAGPTWGLAPSSIIDSEEQGLLCKTCSCESLILGATSDPGVWEGQGGGEPLSRKGWLWVWPFLFCNPTPTPEIGWHSS